MAFIEPTPPPEAQTEAEKTAYCAGWWAALEALRKAEPVWVQGELPPLYVARAPIQERPVQEPDDKAASIRWQLCLLAQTEEFSDGVRNQIARGVWLIDQLQSALKKPNRAQKMRDAGYTRRPTLREMAEPQEPVEPVAKVELMTTGGNAGLATRIVEIDDHLRDRLRPGQLLYTAPPG